MKKIKKMHPIRNIILILIALTFLIPFLLVISISVTDADSIVKSGYRLIPEVFNISAYRMALKNPQQLIRSYEVTVFYSIIGTCLSLIVQSMLAYALSRKEYRFRNVITVYLLITMLFSGGLVPSYILITKYLHLNNTIWVYIIPGLVSAWHVIIIRTFFGGLPNGIVEAARIDGAVETLIFVRIILPLSKPVLATVGFMLLLGKWNDWSTTLIYINNTRLYSLQYLLQKILREAEFLKSMANTGVGGMLDGMSGQTDNMKFAMAILAAGPMLVVFPFFQKYFTKGLTVGSVKG